MMDMAVFDRRENRSHTTYDTGLLTMMDVTSSYDMTSHLFLEPAVILTAAYSISLHLCRTLDTSDGEIHIVLGIQILAQRYAAASAVMYLAVLDDPSLTPVRTYHAVLICGGGCPCGRGILNLKSADCDIAYRHFGGHETVPAYSDLNSFLIGILSLEICIEYGLIAVLFTIPFKLGFLFVPRVFIGISLDTLFQGYGLIHGEIVQIYRSGVTYIGCEIPVTVYTGGIRVI